jgi:hypothetical protein
MEDDEESERFGDVFRLARMTTRPNPQRASSLQAGDFERKGAVEGADSTLVCE